MSDASSPRPRRSKNTYTTRSGKTIKLNRSLSDRVKSNKEAKARRKAAFLSTLPQNRWKRLLYRLHPKRLAAYWFSREGGIMALKVTGISVVVIFLLIVGLFAYFRKDLPRIKDISGNNFGGSITYYDRTGQTVLFQDYDAVKRVPVPSNQISKYVKDATVAIEDKDFYHEGAFNVRGIVRAAFNNATGGSTQGGSTITQQLVKLNIGSSDDRNISNKAKELILAVELEREYNKDDILTGYLNIAPYGNVDYGVESASQDYFGVSASKLSLAQAALLASIPKAPGSFSPYSSPQFNSQVTVNRFDAEGLIGRQQYVLDQMAKQGYISQSDADAAKKVDVLAQVQPLKSHYNGIKAPYFVLTAKEELQRTFPAEVVKRGGWKVVTTLDLNLQTLAEKSLNDNAAKLKARGADNAALVSEDNTTGQIVALVGGMNFETQQVNFASDAPISPGSSIKPYSYAMLINNNNNVGAGSLLYDTQGALPGYPCGNKATPEANPNNPSPCLFDDLRTYNGGVTLRYALGSSLNVPAVKAFTSTDPTDKSTSSSGSNWRKSSISTSMKGINALMGSSDAYKCYDPVALDQAGLSLSQATKDYETPCGSAAGIGNEAYTTLADHVNGIASLARLGNVIPQTTILKVTNSSGKTLKEFTQPAGKQVIKPDAAYIVNNMAADPGASYLSGNCTATNCYGQKFHRYKGWQTAIKTGTNEDLDGLMLNWNTKYTSGVWIGNYDRSGYAGSPEIVTDPVMREYTTGAIDNLGNVTPVNWTQPSDIKTAAAYRSAVPFRSTQATPPATDLYPSWYTPANKSNTSTTTDKVSGKVATSCTPDLARQTSANSNASVFNVDIYSGGVTNTTNAPTTSDSNSTATDDVHNCNDQKPSATISGIVNLANNSSSADPNNAKCSTTKGCTIIVQVEQGTHQLTDSNYPNYPGTLNLQINGQTVQSRNDISSAGQYTFTYTPDGTSGSFQISVQIIDSVLYSGTSSSFNVTSQTAAITPPVQRQTGQNGNNANLTRQIVAAAGR